MDPKGKWRLTNEEKERYIDALSAELPMLRAKAGVPQDELSKLIGVSRQTYGSIERKEKRMSWNTYLSLVFFFDYNKATHRMIRSLSVFPTELIERINDDNGAIDLDGIAGVSMENLTDALDEQALHAIKTVIMVEYARCNNLPGDAVLKSFDGKTFAKPITQSDITVKKALKSIKGNGKKEL